MSSLSFQSIFKKFFSQSNSPTSKLALTQQKKSAASWYRSQVRFSTEYTKRVLPSDSDEVFKKFIENYYNKGKEKIAKTVAKSENPKNECIDIYQCAVGLFTYGELNVVEDILSGLPEGHGKVTRLAYVLQALTPLPNELDPHKNIEAVRVWFKENSAKLKWNPEKEIYEFAELDSQKENSIANPA